MYISKFKLCYRYYKNKLGFVLINEIIIFIQLTYFHRKLIITTIFYKYKQVSTSLLVNSIYNYILKNLYKKVTKNKLCFMSGSNRFFPACKTDTPNKRIYQLSHGNNRDSTPRFKELY